MAVFETAHNILPTNTASVVVSCILSFLLFWKHNVSLLFFLQSNYVPFHKAVLVMLFGYIVIISFLAIAALFQQNPSEI